MRITLRAKAGETQVSPPKCQRVARGRECRRSPYAYRGLFPAKIHVEKQVFLFAYQVNVVHNIRLMMVLPRVVNLRLTSHFFKRNAFAYEISCMLV